MYLKRIVINNFRGIRKLDVDFEKDDTIITGENTWGKSSCLAALWKILGQEGEELCQFTKEDIYKPIEIKAIVPKSYSYLNVANALALSDQNLPSFESILEENFCLHNIRNTKEWPEIQQYYGKERAELIRALVSNEILLLKGDTTCDEVYGKNAVGLTSTLAYDANEAGVVKYSPCNYTNRSYWHDLQHKLGLFLSINVREVVDDELRTIIGNSGYLPKLLIDNDLVRFNKNQVNNYNHAFYDDSCSCSNLTDSQRSQIIDTILDEDWNYIRSLVKLEIIRMRVQLEPMSKAFSNDEYSNEGSELACTIDACANDKEPAYFAGESKSLAPVSIFSNENEPIASNVVDANTSVVDANTSVVDANLSVVNENPSQESIAPSSSQAASIASLVGTAKATFNINKQEEEHGSEIEHTINLDGEDLDRDNKPSDTESVLDRNFLKVKRKINSFVENDGFIETSFNICIDLYFVLDEDIKQSEQYSYLSKKATENRLNENFIVYRVSTCPGLNGHIETRHEIINPKYGTSDVDSHQIIKDIIHLCPLVRIRDSRMLSRSSIDNNSSADQIIIREKLSKLGSSDLTATELQDTLNTLREFSCKYLSFYSDSKQDVAKGSFVDESISEVEDISHRRELISAARQSEVLSKLSQDIYQRKDEHQELIYTIFLGLLFVHYRKSLFEPYVRPIIVLEDMESRLYPTLLSQFLGLLKKVNAQKIVTTNSTTIIAESDFLHLRRLVKGNYDVCAFKVHLNQFSAIEERKIYYHFLNRPSSFFARLWLLVEGQSEVLLFNKVAQKLGYSLRSFGIEIIEYAQCGAETLMKLAMVLGIKFHLLADGDEAGQKYYEQVRKALPDTFEQHASILSALDIEHFLYYNGFDYLYKDAAKAVEDNSESEKAVKPKHIKWCFGTVSDNSIDVKCEEVNALDNELFKLKKPSDYLDKLKELLTGVNLHEHNRFFADLDQNFKIPRQEQLKSLLLLIYSLLDDKSRRLFVKSINRLTGMIWIAKINWNQAKNKSASFASKLEKDQNFFNIICLLQGFRLTLLQKHGGRSAHLYGDIARYFAYWLKIEFGFICYMLMKHNVLTQKQAKKNVVKKIIEKALKHHNKPDMMMIVCDAMAGSSDTSKVPIPLFLQNLLGVICNKARSSSFVFSDIKEV